MAVHHSHRPLSRHERRFRRRIKRELLSARSALIQFTLEAAHRPLDEQSPPLLEREHQTFLNRYRTACRNYALVFGGIQS